MTTLGAMKSDIANVIGDGGKSTEIAAAINRAIVEMQPRGYWFSRSRAETFATVAGQVWYSSTDDASIPKIIRLDHVFLIDSSYNFTLDRIDASEIENDTGGTPSRTKPSCYAQLGESIGIYPMPDAAYTIRMHGLFQTGAPASDGETGNPWMEEGYSLIRAKACFDLIFNQHQDPERAAPHQLVVQQRMEELRQQSNRHSLSRRLKPTRF